MAPPTPASTILRPPAIQPLSTRPSSPLGGTPTTSLSNVIHAKRFSSLLPIPQPPLGSSSPLALAKRMRISPGRSSPIFDSSSTSPRSRLTTQWIRTAIAARRLPPRRSVATGSLTICWSRPGWRIGKGAWSVELRENEREYARAAEKHSPSVSGTIKGGIHAN